MPQIIIWHMRFAWWITKTTYAHTEYVILIAFDCNNGYANAPPLHVIRTLPFLLNSKASSSFSSKENIHLSLCMNLSEHWHVVISAEKGKPLKGPWVSFISLPQFSTEDESEAYINCVTRARTRMHTAPVLTNANVSAHTSQSELLFSISLML
jgi:hypothetical protein